jgi:hypothetical protein
MSGERRKHTFPHEKKPAIGTSAVVFVVVVVLVIAGLAAIITVSGLIGGQVGQIGASGTSGRILVTGTMSVPSSSGNGTLTMEVLDPSSASSPVTGITFSDDGPSPISNVGSLILMYQGQPVSPSNPLALGDTACNSIEVEKVTAGDTYTIGVNLTLQGGSRQYQAFSMTAQLGGGGCTSSSGNPTSTQTSTCAAATPLTLSQTGPVAYRNYGNSSTYPSLILVWQNCSDQTLQFAITSSPLAVTIDTNGTTSVVTGTLDTTFQNSTYAIGAQAGVGLELPITFNPQISPDAVIQHVNGTVTAVDPSTGRPISMQIAVYV